MSMRVGGLVLAGLRIKSTAQTELGFNGKGRLIVPDATEQNRIRMQLPHDDSGCCDGLKGQHCQTQFLNLEGKRSTVSLWTKGCKDSLLAPWLCHVQCPGTRPGCSGERHPLGRTEIVILPKCTPAQADGSVPGSAEQEGVLIDNPNASDMHIGGGPGASHGRGGLGASHIGGRPGAQFKRLTDLHTRGRPGGVIDVHSYLPQTEVTCF
eukprot:scaffold98664_cov20-Tisochrysis_lutea.AAC.1